MILRSTHFFSSGVGKKVVIFYLIDMTEEKQVRLRIRSGERKLKGEITLVISGKTRQKKAIGRNGNRAIG